MSQALRRSPLLALTIVMLAVLPGAGHSPREAIAGGDGRCGLLIPIELPAKDKAGSRVACTHGGDPAPAGVDPTVDFDPTRGFDPRIQAGLILDDPVTGPATDASGTPGVRCYGDGQSGERVQAIYARPSDRADRYGAVLPFIKRWAGEVDAVFSASAAKLGATRHVRYATAPDCQLDVARVVLSPLGDLELATTMAELAAMGYDRPDRKYLVWMDSTELCGIAAYYEDDSVGHGNLNNGNPIAPGVVARVDAGCWGLYNQGESVEAHELMHMLGSVLRSAPHATLLGHCTDESDRMCYEDGPGLGVSDVCGTTGEGLFDCGDDDYFNPAPSSGYLATHWNTAGSSFLAALEGDVPVDVTGGQVVEGDGGTRALNFTVALGAPVTQTVRVNFATADGTATAPGDYEPVSGTLEFAPGETAKTVTVAVRGDADDEADEQFSLVLSSPVDAVASGGGGIGLIVDDDPKGQGYWMVASDGGIFSFADARFFGSTGNIKLNQPIVGMADTPSGQGYWLVARDGGIFSFGDARFFGSTGATKLNQPIVGMASTPTGEGYWMVAADGGIFAFGDAQSFGSAATERLAAPIVGMVPLPNGKGYWLAGADGRVFAFGDAPQVGSVSKPAQPVVGVAGTASGRGLWLVARDGGVFALGDAIFYGSTGNIKLNKPIVGMSRTPSGLGYWLVANDGGIFSFGDAGFYGSTGNINLNQPINGMASIG